MKKICFILLITGCLLIIVLSLINNLEQDYTSASNYKTIDELPLIPFGFLAGVSY